ncbi:MAG TPA: hypothetical protein VEP91_11370 [Solirubrobacterales bacterium]|nr:hypothetical protein [Solirubrobacterales bacterium]
MFLTMGLPSATSNAKGSRFGTGAKEEIPMNNLKMLGLAALAAMVLMAVTAGSASATTLEVGGVVKSGAVTITASDEMSVVWEDTEHSQANTCSVSHFHGITSVFTGAKVTGSYSEVVYSTCTRSPVIVDAKGGFYIEWEPGTTSGTVFSENTEVTLPTTFGFSVSCKTGAGTKIGTLDAASSASSHATLTGFAVLNCGFLLPSASMSGSYVITSPTGLGVTS